MTDPLPSLTALRAFEAAARHLSFKNAADELFVSAGAISQQIRSLEDQLGVPLFNRLTRAVALTPAGQALYPEVHQAFALLGRAVQRVGQVEDSGSLTVSVFPAFAAKWLVPRLGRFYERNPQIQVNLHATSTVVDFRRDVSVDVAIRHGLGQYPGLHITWLMQTELFPVCSPHLLETGPPLREPADLRHHVLLHCHNAREWGMWLDAQGVTGVDGENGRQFSDEALMLEAAADGQGVALTRGTIVAQDLRRGLLAKPFEAAMPDYYGIYLVCPKETAEAAHVRAFREWLLDEIAEQPE